MHHCGGLSEVSEPRFQRHPVAEMNWPLVDDGGRRDDRGDSPFCDVGNGQTHLFQQLQTADLQPLDIHDIADMTGKIDLVGIHFKFTRHSSHTMQTSTLTLLFCVAPLLAQSLPRLASAGLTFAAEDGSLVIRSVARDGNAARAGLLPADVVVAVDGTPVEATGVFVRPLLRRTAPALLRLSIRRAGRSLDIQLHCAAPPDEPGVVYGALAVRDHLRRTLLTMPSGAGKHPAILFLPGSGCSTQESPNRNATESRILHGLTAGGFATLRVEKPSVGDSTGPPCYSAQSDLNLDVETYRTALTFLEEHPAIDPDRLFLFDHSAGASLAPLVAKERKLRGIVLAGAMGTKFYDYVLAMRRRMAVLGQQPPAKFELARSCLTRLLKHGESAEAIVAAQPACRSDVYFDSPPAYITQWNALDLAAAWQALREPGLLLYGTADFVSSEAESRALLAKIRSRSKQLLTLPMDHGFLALATPQQAWNAEGGKGPAPEFYAPVIDRIRDWLNRR